MNIKEMHYDFLFKFNKIDSQKNKNFLVPEIDWFLNEGLEIFIKNVAFPRNSNTYLGFESNQRSIDDIRTLVVNDFSLDVVDNFVKLPENYWHYLNSKVIFEKKECEELFEGVVFIRQHDDNFEEDLLNKSSFEWRFVNALFVENSVKLFDDKTFTNKSLKLSYIKKHPYIHNAEEFSSDGYEMFGKTLTGNFSCILPEQTHREIVDIAVLLASGQIGTPDYQIKQSKVLNNLQ